MRGGLVAGWTGGATSLITGGLLCLLAVGAVATTTPELRDRAPGPAEEAAAEHA
ncbi:hypothetical protein [Streptomyces sp. NPDC002078]